MTRGPDVGVLLERALAASAAAAGLSIGIVTARRQPWESATFVGARHVITLRCAGTGVDAWLAGLPEAELELRGSFVAELATGATRRARDGLVAELEVLTVEVERSAVQTDRFGEFHAR